MSGSPPLLTDHVLGVEQIVFFNACPPLTSQVHHGTPQYRTIGSYLYCWSLGYPMFTSAINGCWCQSVPTTVGCIKLSRLVDYLYSCCFLLGSVFCVHVTIVFDGMLLWGVFFTLCLLFSCVFVFFGHGHLHLYRFRNHYFHGFQLSPFDDNRHCFCTCSLFLLISSSFSFAHPPWFCSSSWLCLCIPFASWHIAWDALAIPNLGPSIYKIGIVL